MADESKLSKEGLTVFDAGITTIAESGLTTMYEATAFDAEQNPYQQAQSAPETVEPGAELLDLYRVESEPFAGGMGKVWRVRHTGWHVDLAMKQPHAELFQRTSHKQSFTRECEAWINLGLHPHTVSCYYVREINGIPSIFAEWMDGGSLKHWLQDGRLYEGEALKRVLDIAIQFGRGLQYAHSYGMIHQDVKPDNVMMTQIGEAKVSDFGLAQATSTGSYTPAYCSPEQANGAPLTLATDIYSWAVSVLEMFLGDRMWMQGSIVGEELDYYLKKEMCVTMPKAMQKLLRRCLNREATARPASFTEIDPELLTIYESVTGNPYPREQPKAVTDTADSLNNRALSYLDLGKAEEAEQCWVRALEINPKHLASTYNQSLHLWNKGQLKDGQAVSALDDNPSDMAEMYRAKLCKANGDYEQALMHLLPADEKYQNRADIKKEIWDAAQKFIADGQYGGFDKISEDNLKKAGIELICFNHDATGVLTLGKGENAFQYMSLSTGESTAPFEESGTFTLRDANAPEGVHKAYFSPDGSKVAIGAYEQVCVWDMRSGKVTNRYKLPFTGPADPKYRFLRSMLFSPDGGKLLTITQSSRLISIMAAKTQHSGTGEEDLSWGGDVWLYSLETDTDMQIKLVKHVLAAHFISDTELLTADDDDPSKIAFRRWDLVSGKNTGTVCAEKDRASKVNAYCFNKDASLFYVNFVPQNMQYSGNEITALDVKTGHVTGKTPCQTSFAMKVDDPHNIMMLLIAGKVDEAAKYLSVQEDSNSLMDFARADRIKVTQGYSDGIISASDDGVMLGCVFSAVLQPSQAYLWNTRTGVCIKTFNRHAVSSVRFTPDGNRMMINGWHAKPMLCTVQKELHCEWMLNRITATGSVNEYKAEFDILHRTVEEHVTAGRIDRALQVLPRMKGVPLFGDSAEVTDAKKSVARYCKRSQLRIGESQTYPVSYNNASFTADNKHVLCIQSGAARLWDIKQRRFSHTLGVECKQDWLSVCASPNGIVATVSENMLALWDGEKLLRSLDFEQNLYKCLNLCFSPDGSLLALNCLHFVYLYETKTLTLVKLLKRRPSKLNADENTTRNVGPVFSPDGMYLALAGDTTFYPEYTSLMIWNVSDGSEAAVIRKSINEMFFAPDSRALYYFSEKELHSFSPETDVDEKIAEFEGTPQKAILMPDGVRCIICQMMVQKGIKYDTALLDLHTGERVRTLFSGGVTEFILSADGFQLVCVHSGTVTVHELDCELSFPGWQNWDDGALPYVELSLARHPDYQEEDFDNLITELQNRGYGWLHPQGVLAKLTEIAGRPLNIKLSEQQLTETVAEQPENELLGVGKTRLWSMLQRSKK